MANGNVTRNPAYPLRSVRHLLDRVRRRATCVRLHRTLRVAITLLPLATVHLAHAATNSWTDLNVGLQPSGDEKSVITVAIDPSTPATLYVGANPYAPSAVLKSTDGGASWLPVGLPTNQTGWVFDLAVHPGMPGAVFSASEFGLNRSTDAGASWQHLLGGGGGVSIAIDPSTLSTMYFGDELELFKITNAFGDITNGFDDWIWLDALNNGLPPPSGSGWIVQPYHVLVDPKHSGTVYVGVGSSTNDLNFPDDPTKYGVWKSIDGGASWVQRNSGIVGNFSRREVRTMAIDPNNTDIVYAGVRDLLGHDGGVFKSVNGGLSWAAVNNGLTGANSPLSGGGTCSPGDCDARQIMSLAFDAATNTLYAGTYGAGVFKTSDGGASWSPFNDGLSPFSSPEAYHVFDLEIDPVTPSRVYAGTLQGLFVRDGCGDGNLDAGEGCDDGDASGGDGCSARCAVEECHVCNSSQPSGCTPAPAGTTCNADDNPCTVDKCNPSSGVCEVTPPPPGWSCGAAVEGMVGGPQHLCENGVRDEVNDTCTLTSPNGHSLVIPDGAVSGAATNISIIEKGTCSFSLGNDNQKTVACVEFEPSGQSHLSGPVTAVLRWSNVAEGTGCAGRGDLCPVLASDLTRTCEGRLHVYGPNGVELTDQCGKASAGGALCPDTSTVSTKCVSPCTGTPTCDPVANTWTISLDHFSEYALVADPCGADVLPVCRPAGKSSLLIEDDHVDYNDKLIFKWLKGEATTPAELGDPTDTTSYTLCLYAGTTAELVGGSTLSAGLPFWYALGDKGYRYKDDLRFQSGIKTAIVSSGVAGRAKAVVKGKGRVLTDPLQGGALPLPVRVQLLNSSTGACFEGMYDGAQVVINDGSQFKAKAQ